MIKVIMRLQPKITCVIRTHCDGIQPTDSKNLKQIIAEDEFFLNQYGLYPRMFTVAVRKKINGKFEKLPMTYLDNQAVFKQLIS